MKPEMFYLLVGHGETPKPSTGAVFYKVEGEALARSLCAVFAKEYVSEKEPLKFAHCPAAEIGSAERILLDEALNELSIYNDPDRFVYDPVPTEEMMRRAQLGFRAANWEGLLKKDMEQNPASPKTESRQHKDAPTADEIPSMPPDQKRNSGLILLMLLAQAYYKMLECTVSKATWATTLDLDLNESYFWTVSCIQNLLENHPDLKDFPMSFEPIFPDLYPSTIADHEWEDMIAPEAEKFLSTVQKYVHSKGMYPPEERSPGWVFVELFRPAVNTAIERAVDYEKKVQAYCERAFRVRDKNKPEGTPSPRFDSSPEAAAKMRDQVFICYAHRDNEGSDHSRRWLDRLKEHLQPLVFENYVAVCCDQDTGFGEEWHLNIQGHLNRARVAILLVSPAFLASNYIRNSELPVLLRRAKDEGVKIVPILLRPCSFENTKFKYPDPHTGPDQFTLASLQAAGSPTKTLNEMTEAEQDRILVAVAQSVYRLIHNAQ